MAPFNKRNAMSELLKIKLFDLSTDRVVEALKCEVELFDNHFTYTVACTVMKMPDPSKEEYEDPVSAYVNYHGTFSKKAITGIDMEFAESSNNGENFDVWVVEIHVQGTKADLIRLKFKKHREALPFYQQLITWWHQGENPERSVAPDGQ